jgi:hypothetical protein
MSNMSNNALVSSGDGLSAMPVGVTPPPPLAVVGASPSPRFAFAKRRCFAFAKYDPRSVGFDKAAAHTKFPNPE